jgi:hypothetical protein
MKGRTIAIVIALAVVAFLPAEAAAQCPMCRQALISQDAAGLAAALRSGILFLLAAPFVVFATVAIVAVRSHRRREIQKPSRPPIDGSV